MASDAFVDGLFYPEKLTQLEERQYIHALGFLNQNPHSKSYEDIERANRLREGTLKTYVRWRRQLDEDMKKDGEKKAREKQKPAKLVNPAELSGRSDLSSIHWGPSFLKSPSRRAFAESDEYRREVLLLAAKDALQRHLASMEPGVTDALSLWAASEIVCKFFCEDYIDSKQRRFGNARASFKKIPISCRGL
jgi:hypothetical protein